MTIITPTLKQWIRQRKVLARTDSGERHTVASWLAERKIRTRNRAWFLLRKAHWDIGEVVLVGAMCVEFCHRFYWKCHGDNPIVYDAMTRVIGGDPLTLYLFVMSLLGVAGCLTHLTPVLRRNVDLWIAAYFVTHGVILLIEIPSNLIALFEVFIFGGLGVYCHWRQMQEKGVAVNAPLRGRD